MIGLIARALHGRPARSYLALAGVGTSTLLVIVLAAAFRAVDEAMTSYVGQPSIDLWVAPQGADNLIRGSFAAELPEAILDSLRTIEGVARADPLLKGFLSVRRPGSRNADSAATLLSIGYRIPDGLGGPPRIDAGAPPGGPREIALDRAAAFRIGVGLGDTVLLGSDTARVSGLTRGTNIVATQFLFAPIALVASGLGADEATSLVVIRVDPDAGAIPVAVRIVTRFPDLRVYPRAMFLRANRREVLSGFLPLLSLIAVLGVGAACVLVGLLVLSVVDEKRAELAVLIAMGARPFPVARAVLLYVIALLGLGVGIGVLLALGLTELLDQVLPTIPLAMTATDTFAVVAAFGLSGLLAATVPVVQLLSIDPLEAFRP